MKFLKLTLGCLISLSLAADMVASELYYYRAPEKRDEQQMKFEVVAYGGTPAGVSAVVQAGRLGKKALLITNNAQVGGMTSGGLTATDLGKPDSIGGIALEFYKRLGSKLDFSPSNAEAMFLTMLDEAGVVVLRNRFLESVNLADGKISSITMGTGETIAADVFIDSTYEGDLYAAAGVSYHLGREPRSAYDESLAGQWQTVSWKNIYQFCDLPLSPFKKPGDPESGLLPGISSHPYGKPGEGDHRVQAYNFRMFLSDKETRVAFPKPVGYEPDRYALLARFLNINADITWTLHYTTRPMTDGPVQMRNGDSNNAGSFSSNNVNGSHFWPDGTFEPINFAELPPPRRGMRMPLNELYLLREKIFQDHVTYQQGYMYFLANDPQVPKDLQDRVNKFGLDANEFPTTGHWPHALYVREGRRMISDYVMTQANCEGKRVAEDSIGLASYPMDSHPCQRVVVERDGTTTVRNEGAFGHGGGKPYPISYRSIVPKRAECRNLLVPVCLSASHVAYGSIRMEPVFMILGQSAGHAAVMAIDAGIDVQDVPYPGLKKRLLADGQFLKYPTR